MGEPMWRQMLAGVLCAVLGHKRERQDVRSVLPAGGHEQIRVRCVRRGCLSLPMFEERPRG